MPVSFCAITVERKSCASLSIEEIVKSQIKILKKNEENYRNVSDPILKSDCGDGTITRKTVTQYIRDCS